MNKRYSMVMAAALCWYAAQAVSAQDPCESATFIHNYPVHDAGAYDELFDVVEGYVPGPEAERPWPFAEGGDKTYPTRDFCPVDPDDRLVRLFEVEPREIERASMQTGTLTLVVQDLKAARRAASGLAPEAPRDQELQGRRSIYFTDAAGNELFVWEHPGPPGS